MTLLIEPSQTSNEIQAWTESFEHKNSDRLMKMREEMENKFHAILKEISTSKTASTITNSRFELNGSQNSQPSGSKNDKSSGVEYAHLIKKTQILKMRMIIPSEPLI